MSNIIEGLYFLVGTFIFSAGAGYTYGAGYGVMALGGLFMLLSLLGEWDADDDPPAATVPCPECGSGSMSAKQIKNDDGDVWKQSTRCRECGWSDVWVSNTVDAPSGGDSDA